MMSGLGMHGETQPNPHHRLVTAAGNFYGEGYVRRDELVAAAELLGIGEDRVHVLDHPELQVPCALDQSQFIF